ncbi:MAG: hypothetical protein PHR25_05075 [Clostridia bacterium]|nr:hypothetical protein [Clostridia bacterium]MDD4376137.1 hypothetical protein [Clostridia bacterium]
MNLKKRRNIIKVCTYLYIEEIAKNTNYNNVIKYFNVKAINNKTDPLSKTLIYIIEKDTFENKRLINYMFTNDNKVTINSEFYLLSSKNKSIFIGDALNLTLKNNINIKNKLVTCELISIALADIVIINKVDDIKKGFELLDFALDLGKEIYGIPGEIYSKSSYLSNYAIKTGAIPLCTKRDGIELLQNCYKKEL